MLYKNVFKNPKLPAEARMLSLNDILCGTMSQYPQDLLKALSWYVYSNVPLELALKEKKCKFSCYVEGQGFFVSTFSW